MKITIDIDCSPAEARSFFGLPDMESLQKAVLAAAEERLGDAVRGMDAETLVKTWLPQGLKGVEEWQKAFWSGLADAAQGGGKPDGKTS